MPTDNRATAERIARDEQWNPSDEDLIDRFKQCAFGGVESLREWLIKAQPHDVGRVREELVRFARHLLTWDRLEQRAVARRMAHRDRTAEREAAKKAIDHMGEQPRSESSRDWTLARDRYLAAEFDAGERVTLSDGSVVTRRYSHIEEADVLVHDENGNGRIYLLRDFPNILRSVHTGADFDAVKRLAEQRGAER